LDAEILLAHAWGRDRAALYRDLYDPPPPDVILRFLNLVRCRRTRVPVAYLVGVREFGDLLLRVGPGVLVPRPETELLVETVVAWLGSSPAISPPAFSPPADSTTGARPPPRTSRSEIPRPRVLDIGCGSGNISISIARAMDGARVVGADVSEMALQYAIENRAAAGVSDRVDLMRFDVVRGPDAIRSRSFDVVVSNPPYVSRPASGFDGELAHEPELALSGGSGPFPAIYEAIAALAARILAEGGLLAVEVGEGQADVVAEIFGRRFEQTARRLDLAGIERVVTASGVIARGFEETA